MAAVADPDVDPVRIGVVEARYARVLLGDAGRTDAALVAARRAVSCASWADPPTPERGVAVAGLVHVLDWVGGGADWEPLADEAVEVARATGDAGALARALVIRMTVRPAGPGVVEDAREAVDLALTDGDPELIGQTYSNVVDCLEWAGRGREGIDAAATGGRPSPSADWRSGTAPGWSARAPSWPSPSGGGTRPTRCCPPR